MVTLRRARRGHTGHTDLRTVQRWATTGLGGWDGRPHWTEVPLGAHSRTHGSNLPCDVPKATRRTAVGHTSSTVLPQGTHALAHEQGPWACHSKAARCCGHGDRGALGTVDTGQAARGIGGQSSCTKGTEVPWSTHATAAQQRNEQRGLHPNYHHPCACVSVPTRWDVA